MTQSIELLLDDDLDAAVRAEWDVLKQASLPSMARHTGESNCPHITMAIADRIPDDVEDTLGELAEHVPFGVRLGALTLFAHRSGRVILVRLVVPSAELLAVHAQTVKLVQGLAGAGGHLRPGHWTPHVTLASGLAADKVAIALEVLGELPSLEGKAVAVRRWDSLAKRTWTVS